MIPSQPPIFPSRQFHSQIPLITIPARTCLPTTSSQTLLCWGGFADRLSPFTLTTSCVGGFEILETMVSGSVSRIMPLWTISLSTREKMSCFSKCARFCIAILQKAHYTLSVKPSIPAWVREIVYKREGKIKKETVLAREVEIYLYLSRIMRRSLKAKSVCHNDMRRWLLNRFLDLSRRGKSCRVRWRRCRNAPSVFACLSRSYKKTIIHH